MYAIIAESGRQLKVEAGQQVDIDYRDVSAGDKLTFDRVLCINDDDRTLLGQPTIAGASVTAEVVGVTQGKKLVVQKIRRRKNFRRKTGHRQLYTTVTIDKITAPKGRAKPKAKKKTDPPEDEGDPGGTAE